MKNCLYILGIFCFTWCLSSCEKYSSYSDIPEIYFKKLIVESRSDAQGNLDKTTVLTFHFKDGTGDIGVRDTSSATDMLSQIYVTWKKKLPDGTYETYQFNDGSTVQLLKIPYDNKMNRDKAQNKILKGTIEVSLFAPTQSLGNMDTVRLEYYIMDRASHPSNIDYTPDFSILAETVHLE